MCSPDDAVRAFLDGRIDGLAAGPFYVESPFLGRYQIVIKAQDLQQRTVAEVEVIRLSREAQEQFVALLLDPPPPAPALRRALERHRSLIAE